VKVADLSDTGRAVVLVTLLGVAVAVAFASFVPLVAVLPGTVVLVWAAIAWQGEDLAVSLTYSGEVFLEGDQVTVMVEVTGAKGVALVRVVTEVDEVFERAQFSLRPDGSGSCCESCDLTLKRFGTHRPRIFVAAYGLLGLVVVTRRISLENEVCVYPRFGQKELLQGLSPRGFGVGRHSSRARGSGHDFIGIRPAFPGESLRSVNWRLTARAGSFWVNERQPERPLDIVIFLDTFSASGIDDGARLASDIARSHLGAHDLVGLVLFGGTVGWVPLGSGSAHLESLLTRLMRVRVFPSASEKSYRLVPPYILPRRVRVVAVSNLVDQRARRALLDMAHDGYSLELVVVPVVPAPGEAGRLEALLAARDLSVLRRSGVKVREVVRG